MKKLLLILLIAMLTSCNQRKSAENSDQVATPTLPDFFDANAPRAQVLLLGVAHFKDANADRYKPKYSLDIMSDKRQKELNDLLTNLEMFNPTKIVLEVRTEQQHLLDSLYTEYLNGTFDLGPHERFQIGFKLAKRLHLKQLIAGDTRGNEYDYIVSDYPRLSQ